jgi:hypothetical protein
MGIQAWREVLSLILRALDLSLAETFLVAGNCVDKDKSFASCGTK